MIDKLLLVEDDPDSVELTLFALERAAMAMAVDVAHDGLETLERLSKDPLPKIILLDLNMPRMDGFETLRRIRADARTQRLPVIILTLSTRDEDISRCVEMGANGYVCKFSNLEKFALDLGRTVLPWLGAPSLKP